MCFGFLSVPYDMEVLAYPDMVMYASGVQECKPVAPDKLSVCHQMSDTAFAGKTKKPCNEFLALLSVGVASLVPHLEDDRESHSIVDNAECEDVDISITELPVSPVHRQGIRSLYRYES